MTPIQAPAASRILLSVLAKFKIFLEHVSSLGSSLRLDLHQQANANQGGSRLEIPGEAPGLESKARSGTSPRTRGPSGHFVPTSALFTNDNMLVRVMWQAPNVTAVQRSSPGVTSIFSQRLTDCISSSMNRGSRAFVFRS